MKKILLSVALVATSFGSNSQIIVNGDFEAAVTSPLPGIGQTAGWGNGIFVAETTSPYAGLQSAKLETIYSPDLAALIAWESDTLPGIIIQTVNGPINNPANLQVSFAYKYTRVASDTGIVIVQLLDTVLVGDTDDIIRYQGFVEFTATTSNWATMALDLFAFAPGTVNRFVIVAFSSYNAVASPGTTLWVDNFTTGYLGIEENEVATVVVYPNPATDVLNIKMNENATSVSIIGMDGKVISTESVNSNLVTVNVSNLVSGVYFYEVVAANGTVIRNTFVKQ